MNAERSETINGHLVDEYVWGRDFVVYVDHQRWDASYETALAWARAHADPRRYPYKVSPQPPMTPERER